MGENPGFCNGVRTTSSSHIPSGMKVHVNWHDLPRKQVPGESTEENNHENVKRKHKRLKTNTAFKNVLTS